MRRIENVEQNLEKFKHLEAKEKKRTTTEEKQEARTVKEKLE